MYSKPMYNLCMRMVNHVGEAEDILQESFIDAFKNIEAYRGDATFGAWLKRIVVNKSLNYLKKRKLQITDVDNAADVTDTKEEEHTELDIQQVQKAIQQLPDGYRVVLTLYLIEDYSHGEIAKMLNISESTSKSQYNRAKAKIREQLSKQGV
ncbi:MAG: RNA polymerase sigma factor [Bacteroidetes bacterium]|nr:RNA polymerase sigma factor [Bacteroidota bacterium]